MNELGLTAATHIGLSALLTSVTTAALGAFVLIKNSRSNLYRVFSLYSFSIALWERFPSVTRLCGKSAIRHSYGDSTFTLALSFIPRHVLFSFRVGIIFRRDRKHLHQQRISDRSRLRQQAVLSSYASTALWLLMLRPSMESNSSMVCFNPGYD